MCRLFVRASTAVVLLFAVGLLSGCSDLTAQVGGVVYLDDKPVELTSTQRGMVVFRPVAGGATCTGLVQPDGSYQIATGGTQSLAPGDYLVSVRIIQLVEAAIENEAPSGKPITPAVYGDPLTSGLTCMVKNGGNAYDIDLKSSAGPAEIQPEAASEEVELDSSLDLELSQESDDTETVDAGAEEVGDEDGEE